MQFIKFVFVLSSTTLIGTLFCQSSNAFTVTQSTSQMDSFALSKLKDGGTGLTLLRVLDPDDPLNSTKSTRFVTEIERGGTKGLLSDLTLYTNLSRNPWTFNRGRDLQGRFNVKTHYACGTKTSCGAKKGGVGSVLRLEYIPEIRSIPGTIPDPNPKQNKNLHWIQRVITNYPGSKKVGAFGNKK
ncbi:MAG: hypothetical protein LH628_27315 [Microcoleus sp. CAN_BIN18]|nr:hypothetical protein [Microcoleus sp. CAN_BIN18]